MGLIPDHSGHGQEPNKRSVSFWLDQLRVLGRRAAHACHNMVVGRRYTGPVSFLALSASLGLALTVTTLYTTSFAVYVDGENLGVVANQSTVENAVDQVERRGSDLLGYTYTVDSDISYQFGLSLRTDLTHSTVFENYSMPSWKMWVTSCGGTRSLWTDRCWAW